MGGPFYPDPKNPKPLYPVIPDQTRETRAAYIRGYTAGYRAALEGIRYSIEKQARNLPYRGEQPVDNSSSTGYKPLEINGD